MTAPKRKAPAKRRTRAKATFDLPTSHAPVEPDAEADETHAQPEIGLAADAVHGSIAIAATHRQVIPTGTVAEVRALQPPVTALEADDLDIADYQHQFIDPHVQAAAAFIDRSGIAEFMKSHHEDNKDNRGAKETIPFRAILVALWLVATDGGNLWMTNIRDVLFHQISPASRRMLGITYPDRPTPLVDAPRNEKTSKRNRRWDDASEKTVGRTFHRMLKTIDPSVHPKNRILTWQELAELSLPLSLRQQQEYQARLDWVCNRLLETAFKTLPRHIRRKYKGSACIDATPMGLYSVGRGKTNTECSSDPDGGFYGRQHGHDEPDRIRDAKWALEVHLLVAVDCHHGEKQYLPALPLAMTTDRPGFDPSGAARRIFAYIQAAGYPVRWLAGDLLYTDQKPEKFQTAARAIGYKPVLGYGPKHHGRQGSHRSGAHMVEGNFYCPAMPEHLVNATVLRRSKDDAVKITHEQWQQAIADRLPYLMRTKAKPDANGNGERLGCPASGTNPVAACSLKPASQEERRTRQPGGMVVDARIDIDPSGIATGDGLPEVCAQDTISIRRTDTDEAIDRYRQELRYGTVQHLTTYVRLRQAQEGLHGFAKRQAAKALEDANARRVRGKAAQTPFAALLLAAASIAKIRKFLHTAHTDANGDRWIKRQHLTSALRTPPGDAAPDKHSEDEAEDENPPPE